LEVQLRLVPPDGIVVFEDIDVVSATHQRKDDEEHPVVMGSAPERINKLTLGGLLNNLDGILAVKADKITIMTTNYRDRLDSALIRPGRADVHLELLPMTPEAAKQTFLLFVQKKGGSQRAAQRVASLIEQELTDGSSMTMADFCSMLDQILPSAISSTSKLVQIINRIRSQQQTEEFAIREEPYDPRVVFWLIQNSAELCIDSFNSNQVDYHLLHKLTDSDWDRLCGKRVGIKYRLKEALALNNFSEDDYETWKQSQEDNMNIAPIKEELEEATALSDLQLSKVDIRFFDDCLSPKVIRETDVTFALWNQDSSDPFFQLETTFFSLEHNQKTKGAIVAEQKNLFRSLLLSPTKKGPTTFHYGILVAKGLPTRGVLTKFQEAAAALKTPAKLLVVIDQAFRIENNIDALDKLRQAYLALFRTQYAKFPECNIILVDSDQLTTRPSKLQKIIADAIREAVKKKKLSSISDIKSWIKLKSFEHSQAS